MTVVGQTEYSTLSNIKLSTTDYNWGAFIKLKKVIENASVTTGRLLVQVLSSNTSTVVASHTTR
jgi:hypothetical protein